MTRPSLKQINSVLLALIILINGYIVAAPFAPRVSYWWGEHVSHRSKQLQTQLMQARPAMATHSAQEPVIPKDNRLIVPTMQLDAPILEGSSVWTVNKGIWHRPSSSTPDKGGNTVLVGHRFTYTNPKGIFYYLDRVKIGDTIGIYWHGTKYIYRVTDSFVVPPTATRVEASTDDSRLTLYTCTPLWAPKDRLVVVATLESTS